MAPAIHCSGLTKRFGDVVALRGVDLEVPRGARIGLVGPNGAGKSTLLACCAGVHTPSTGSVMVDGRSIHGARPRPRKQLGYAPDVVGVRGSGASPSRIALLRRGDQLAGKKVVIWLLTAREFTETQGWRPVPIVK